MNSKLPNQPKTSPNIKLCVTKIAQRMTYIQLLWSVPLNALRTEGTFAISMMYAPNDFCKSHRI